MTGIDLNSYKDLYLKTAKDHLDNLKVELGLLQQGKQTSTTLEDIHRRFHSLKSQSLIMGYPSLGELAKTLELFLKNIIETKNPPTSEQCMSIEQATAEMTESLDSIQNTGKEIDLSKTSQKLNEQFSMHNVMSKLHSLGITK